MKTENEINADILKIILKIKETFPELSKYMGGIYPEIPENVDQEDLKYYCDSLYELLKEYSMERTARKEKKNMDTIGYPLYPENEDVYSKWEEKKNINPEDISKVKTLNEKVGTNNEKDFSDDVSGSDLDVPGSELDDQQESVGSEDEENNYYSLGGDNHYD